MRPRGRGGIALVAVLWALVLISAIAAGFLYETRTQTTLARNLLENAKARALADAGVHRAVLALIGPRTEGVGGPEIANLLRLAPDPGAARRRAERALGRGLASARGAESEGVSEQGWRADGTVYAWAFAGGEARISIADEGGKIDLNAAPDELLRGLFVVLGVDGPEAAELVDAIADFRDADDFRRANGAEDDDYRAAGLPWQAKDAPFAAVEELGRVMGMTPELYAKAAPFVTVHSKRGKIDLVTAPREVLLAVPGIVAAEVEALLAARANVEGPIPRRALPVPTAQRGYFSMSNRRYFTVRAEARTESGAVFVREAVVKLTGKKGERPFRLLGWRQGRLREPPAGQ